MKWRLGVVSTGRCWNTVVTLSKWKRGLFFFFSRNALPTGFWDELQSTVKFPSHCNIGVQQSTEQRLSWKHLSEPCAVREGACRRRPLVKHLGSSFPGKAEHSLSGTCQPQYWPCSAESGCSWNSQRSIHLCWPALPAPLQLGKRWIWEMV